MAKPQLGVNPGVEARRCLFRSGARRLASVSPPSPSCLPRPCRVQLIDKGFLSLSSRTDVSLSAARQPFYSFHAIVFLLLPHLTHPLSPLPPPPPPSPLPNTIRSLYPRGEPIPTTPPAGRSVHPRSGVLFKSRMAAVSENPHEPLCLKLRAEQEEHHVAHCRQLPILCYFWTH